MTELNIYKVGAESIPVIQGIAQNVWPQTYSPLISMDQIQYMLELMYSTKALEEQLNNQHQFILASYKNKPVGFASFSPTKTTREYQLQKLYVDLSFQKQGIGRLLFRTIVEDVKQLDGLHLILQVNRNNLNAIEFYKRMELQIEKEMNVAIGNNFFMNDYIMGIYL
ncbi:MAG: GNAT family N-acetyltransferase [Lacibacter sp.]